MTTEPTDLAQPGELMRLARVRMKPRMSQTELGSRVGLSKDQLGRIERGEVIPHIKEFFAVMHATNQAGLIEQLTRNNNITGLSLDAVLPGQLSLIPLLESAA